MKIWVGGAIGRYYEPDHVGSIMRLLQALGSNGIYAPRFNDAAIDRARSQCATEFLGSDCDVQIQIDSDIVFDAQDAIRVCQAAMTQDVVGGIYTTRHKGKYCFPTSLPYNDRRIEFGNDPALQKVRYLAGGFHAVHRRVYEKLSQDSEHLPLLNGNEPDGRFYPFYIPTWTTGENGTLTYLSEDWAFAYRAQQAGFGVWIDPSVRLIHIGMHPYRIEDMLTEVIPTQWMALTRHQGGMYRREALADPLPQSASAG